MPQKGKRKTWKEDRGEIQLIMKKLATSAIRLYQWTWFLRRPSCRFYPSCSSYAITAIEKHGSAAGLYLAVKRLLACHPFHRGGVDFVPDQFELFANKR